MNRLILTALLALLLTPNLRAAPVNDSLWQPLPQRELASRGLDTEAGRLWRLDETSARLRLQQAEEQGRAEITLPVDGQPRRFEVTPSPIMAPQLAARYPEIRTYRIRGIDIPSASGRLSMTARGLDAMFDVAGETRYIDLPREGNGLYRTRKRSQLADRRGFSCATSGRNTVVTRSSPARQRPAGRAPGKLRVYRLAIAATVEYSDAVRRSTSTSEAAIRQDVINEIIRLVNRINVIYERDLAIRLQLVSGQNLIFVDPPPVQFDNSGDAVQDPFTNTNGELMLSENQRLIDSVIGPANYDIGHVLSTGGGGVANVNSVCKNPDLSGSGGKAGGVTGSPYPMGDGFYVDYVAHEMGHQFGADHSFNGTTASCSGNRWSAQAWEPGSGSTIMSYAGICGSENTSWNALDSFHGGSIAVIDAARGLACGQEIASNNREPTVAAGQDRVIPKLTPFRLEAVASDADNDALVYAWEQMDAGSATSGATFGRDLGDNALFRSYGPQTVAWRDFPSLGLTLKGLYDKAEVLPCQSRTLNFRVTVRDGNKGLAQDDLKLTVDGASGPFRVTSHASAETLYPNTGVIVTWDPAGTELPPVSCPTVDISLLSFGVTGNQYGETLLATNEPNDGEAVLILPNRFAARARFKVACRNNVFYAVSAADLRIEGDSTNPFPTLGFVAFSNPDAALTASGQLMAECTTASGSDGGTSLPAGSGSGGGSGSLAPGWLWLLAVLRLRGFLLRRFRGGSGS